MIDDFDGDSARFRFIEGSRRVAIERFPHFLIDFGLERGF